MGKACEETLLPGDPIPGGWSPAMVSRARDSNMQRCRGVCDAWQSVRNCEEKVG